MNGLALIGEPRQGRAGRWWVAKDADGRRRGALLINPAALVADGALDRVVAAVTRLRDNPVDGVAPVVDLVSDDGQVWLVSADPPAPTLAEQLAADQSTVDSMRVASAVARTLIALHANEIAHGAIGATTVAVRPEVQLLETGLLPALTGQDPGESRAADVRGWSALVRALSDNAPGETSSRLRTAAATAEMAGLRAALAKLAGRTAERPAIKVAPRKAAAAAMPAVPVPAAAGLVSPAPTPVNATQLGARDLGTEGKAGARPRRGGRPVLLMVLLFAVLAVVAVGAWFLLRGDEPLRVTGATVDADVPPGCDVTVDVFGTIRTSGAGTVKYRWERSDGQTSEVLTQPVTDGVTRVHLRWELRGKGTYDAESTLVVLEPNRTESTGRFTYSCP